MRDRILKQAKGDRAFVELLQMAHTAGLDVLQVACECALEHGVVTAAVVLNEMRRLIAPTQPTVLTLPDQLQLKHAPQANCARYDDLRGNQHVLH